MRMGNVVSDKNGHATTFMNISSATIIAVDLESFNLVRAFMSIDYAGMHVCEKLR